MYPTSAMIIVTYCNSHWFHVSLSWILIHFDSQSTDDIIIIIICNPSLTNDVYIYESTTKAMQRKARRTKYVCSGITQHTNHKSTDNKKVNNVSTLIWFQFLLIVLELSHFWVDIVFPGTCRSWPPRCWNTWRVLSRRGDVASEIHMTQGNHPVWQQTP